MTRTRILGAVASVSEGVSRAGATMPFLEAALRDRPPRGPFGGAGEYTRPAVPIT